MRLLFVYNADADPFSRLVDYAHKHLAPSTYPCGLCALTHGPLGPRRRWSAYLAGLPYETVFLYRDAFRARHGDAHALPAVFAERRGQLAPLLDARAIAEAADPGSSPRQALGHLMDRLDAALARLSPSR